MNKFDGYESGCMTDTFLLTSYATSTHPLSSPWAMAGCAEENRVRHSSNETWDLQAWERRTGGKRGGQREIQLPREKTIIPLHLTNCIIDPRMGRSHFA